ncbi:hypothetical protein BU17DRAFT_64399 [Hysterangium stoloniferum]|nr:hypothetical protein BU17DRAFT_64399 [Hysterangium stoloniferum]
MSTLIPEGTSPNAIPRMLSRPSLLPTSSSPGRGSRSPTSIPSSPTSIRSASSAIFERDIEPITASTSTYLNVNSHHPQSHTHTHHPNPHRTPRSHQTEQSVPSVLAEAATALAHSDDAEAANISILAPIVSSNVAVGMAMAMSRSPSPRGFASPSSVSSPFGGSAPLPGDCPVTAPPTTSSPPSSYPSSPHLSPTDHPHTQPTRGLNLLSETSPHIDPSCLPPQPHTSSSRRLSFVSYTDILSSTPISAIPLNAYTSGAVGGTMGTNSASAAGRNSLFISEYLEQTQSPPAPQEPYSLLDGYTPETLPSTLPPTQLQLQPSAQPHYIHPAQSLSHARTSSPPNPTLSRSRSRSPPAPEPHAKNARLVACPLEDGNTLSSSTHATEWQREGLGRGMEEVLDGA